MLAKDIKEFTRAFIANVLTLVRRVGDGIHGLLVAIAGFLATVANAILGPVRTFLARVTRVFRALASRVRSFFSAVSTLVRGALAAFAARIRALGAFVLKILKALGSAMANHLRRLKAWLLGILRQVYLRYLLPYYRKLMRFLRGVKAEIVLNIRLLRSALKRAAARIRKAAAKVAHRTFVLLKTLYLAVKTPVLRFLARVYGFFTALVHASQRVLLWLLGISLWFLKRLAVAIQRTGNSSFLALLPFYQKAVIWYNSHHPILATFGRAGLAVYRVGRTTGHAAGKAVVLSVRRLHSALARVLALFAAVLSAVVLIIWTVLSGGLLRLSSLLHALYAALATGFRRGALYLALFLRTFGYRLTFVLRSLANRLSLALRAVGRSAHSLLVPVARALKNAILWALHRIRGALRLVAATVSFALSWAATKIAVFGRRAFGVARRFWGAVVFAVRRTLSTLYHVITTPVKRSGLAVSRTGKTALVFTLLALGILGGWVGLVALKVVTPLSFFFSRNILALSHVSYSGTLALRIVVRSAARVLAIFATFLANNAKVMAEMFGIFSPSILGGLWFLFFDGGVTILLGAVAYAVLLTLASHLYNKRKEREHNV